MRFFLGGDGWDDQSLSFFGSKMFVGAIPFVNLESKGIPRKK